MGNLTLNGATSGQITLAPPSVAGTNTISLPAQTATVLTDSSAAMNIGSGQIYKDASGNVGIGTSSPFTKLHLTSNGAQTPSFAIPDPSNSRYSVGIGSYNVAGVGQRMDFYTGDSGANGTNLGSGALRMSLDSSGNLLVNTTSADARFVVVDSATSGWGARILKSSGGGTPQGLQVVVGQNSSNEVFQCAQGSSFTSPTNLFRITGNGGINTGTASVSPYNNTTASAANMVVSASGDLQRSTSSLKYKTDVKDATHGLAEVMQLRPVTYKGKNDGDTVFGGLIAEEVDAVGLTEFVQYAEDGSPDALAYGNMVSLLVKSIQEQQTIISDLQSRIAALEAK